MKIQNDKIYRINEDCNIRTERVVGTSICVARMTASNEWGDWIALCSLINMLVTPVAILSSSGENSPDYKEKRDWMSSI